MKTTDELNGGSQGVQEQTAGVTVPVETATKPPKASVAKPKATKKTAKASKGKTASAAKAKAPKTAPKDGKGAKVSKGKANGKGGTKVTVKSAKADKTAKATGVPEICPFRQTSSYAKVWAILHAHRQQGMTRPNLIAEAVKATGKPAKNIGYDVAVVLSPKEDGTAHKSANRAADRYFVIRTGDNYRLHLR